MSEIKFDLKLSAEDKKNLRSILGAADDTALNGMLAKVARAGLQEHLDMYLGAGAYSRGTDFKEHRLAMLCIHLFDATIPDEGRVARMFQLTRTSARTLLRNIISKYQLRLAAPLSATLQRLLKPATARGPDKHAIMCTSPALIQELNDRLKELPDPYPPITALSDEAGRYSIDNATLEALKKVI